MLGKSKNSQGTHCIPTGVYIVLGAPWILTNSRNWRQSPGKTGSLSLLALGFLLHQVQSGRLSSSHPLKFNHTAH